ncbi:MAG: hypothetical protein U0414_12410 [Polyangiaceae bacterium]
MNGVDVVEAPVVVVSRHRVTVNGAGAGDVSALVAADRPKDIPELTAALASRRALALANYPAVPPSPEWLLSLPVEMPAVVLKSVIASAARAGFTRVGILVGHEEATFSL